MKKKKIFMIALCIVVALSFTMMATACGGGGDSSDEPAAEETAPDESGAEEEAAPAEEEAAPAEEAAAPAGNGDLVIPDLSGQDLVIGVSTGSSGTAWRDSMIESMQQVGDEYKQAGIIKDIKISNNTTNGDANEQAQIIGNLIDDPEVNIIVIDPNDATALNDAIGRAQEAGKLVVITDSPVDLTNVPQVALDNYGWMLKNVEWFAKTYQEGDAIDIFGLDGHPANVLREQAVDDGLKDYPDIKLLQRISGGWENAKAKEVTAQIIASGSAPDGVICQDGMAYGILSAYQDAGKLPKVLFGDGSPIYVKEWKKLVDAGEDFQSAAQPNPPGIGGSSIRIAVSLAQGKSFKDGLLQDGVYYMTPTTYYTNENLDELVSMMDGQPDDYVLTEIMAQDQVDELFN